MAGPGGPGPRIAGARPLIPPSPKSADSVPPGFDVGPLPVEAHGGMRAGRALPGIESPGPKGDGTRS